MLSASLQLPSTIYLSMTLNRAENSTRTLFNTMLLLHLPLWVLTLIAQSLVMGPPPFGFMENSNTSVDICCPSQIVIHATVNFTYMIPMQPTNTAYLAMAISPSTLWQFYSDFFMTTMPTVPCTGMHMKFFVCMMLQTTPSSYVSFQAMILDDIICQQLTRLVLSSQETTGFREIIVISSFTSDLSITTICMMERTMFSFLGSMKGMLHMLPFIMFCFSHMENLAGIKGSPSPTIPDESPFCNIPAIDATFIYQ